MEARTKLGKMLFDEEYESDFDLWLYKRQREIEQDRLGDEIGRLSEIYSIRDMLRGLRLVERELVINIVKFRDFILENEIEKVDGRSYHWVLTVDDEEEKAYLEIRDIVGKEWGEGRLYDFEIWDVVRGLIDHFLEQYLAQSQDF